jgi:hypothetical protein
LQASGGNLKGDDPTFSGMYKMTVEMCNILQGNIYENYPLMCEFENQIVTLFPTVEHAEDPKHVHNLHSKGIQRIIFKTFSVIGVDMKLINVTNLVTGSMTAQPHLQEYCRKVDADGVTLVYLGNKSLKMRDALDNKIHVIHDLKNFKSVKTFLSLLKRHEKFLILYQSVHVKELELFLHNLQTLAPSHTDIGNPEQRDELRSKYPVNVELCPVTDIVKLYFKDANWLTWLWRYYNQMDFPVDEFRLTELMSTPEYINITEHNRKSLRLFREQEKNVFYTVLAELMNDEVQKLAREKECVKTQDHLARIDDAKNKSIVWSTDKYFKGYEDYCNEKYKCGRPSADAYVPVPGRPLPDGYECTPELLWKGIVDRLFTEQKRCKRQSKTVLISALCGILSFVCMASIVVCVCSCMCGILRKEHGRHENDGAKSSGRMLHELRHVCKMNKNNDVLVNDTRRAVLLQKESNAAPYGLRPRKKT